MNNEAMRTLSAARTSKNIRRKEALRKIDEYTEKMQYWSTMASLYAADIDSIDNAILKLKETDEPRTSDEA